MKKLVYLNIPARPENMDKTVRFYENFFGITFARSLTNEIEAWHAPLSNDGTLVTITEAVGAECAEHCKITPYFCVDDMDVVIREIADEGGTVVAGPFDLPVAGDALADYKERYERIYGRPLGTFVNSLGRAAIVEDAEGNRIGLSEMHEHLHIVFNVGEYLQPLSHKTLAQHDETVRYAQTFFAKHVAEEMRRVCVA
jgi:predicted enzyme related to lactoylglutathione lyase